MSASKYISEQDRAIAMSFKGLKKSKFKSNYAGFFNDRELESLLAYIFIWRLAELQEEENILVMMKECIAIVESELKK